MYWHFALKLGMKWKIAYNWYEDQKAKLGEDFLTCVDSTLDRIEQRPESYPCCFPGFSTSCDSSVSLRDLLSNHRPPNHCDCSRSRKKRSQDLAIHKMIICFTHCHDRRWRPHIGDAPFINGVKILGLDVISKLRQNANLRYLFEGEQKARGARRKYDGKVDFTDLLGWRALKRE